MKFLAGTVQDRDLTVVPAARHLVTLEPERTDLHPRSPDLPVNVSDLPFRELCPWAATPLGHTHIQLFRGD
ncbi:hypothetical protein GCM10023350_41790 [Nocardioides endophyticus]|uniref:Uncharacterized protein n=1 Tax=Nocardioides endophyticus TaxID=1353775 RepID=A0ABP8ZBX1_9ACTN